MTEAQRRIGRRTWLGLGLLPWVVPLRAAATEPERTSALLVGVGAIASLPRRLWLGGPNNDVRLMRQTLLGCGVRPERVTMLAQGPAEAASAPTFHNVTAAMQQILDAVRPGEHVVLHLAGHGAQVPQRAGARWPEPDGLDEVFLLEDVQAWNAQEGRLPNALLDDDIGDWMDSLVDRGATVLAVFDCCHAAGMARDDGRATRVRAVPSVELGVPQGALQAARSRTSQTPVPRMDGRVLAHAARAVESTVEEWLPRGAGMRAARMHGVFTYAVAKALAEGVTTPQTLQGAVRQRYASEGRSWPVPQISGDGFRLLL